MEPRLSLIVLNDTVYFVSFRIFYFDFMEVIELAKRFIGKDCIIYAFDSNHQFEGVIKEVSDGAILIEKEEKLEAINLDFVIRIREYPRNKKGEKKSLVLD